MASRESRIPEENELLKKSRFEIKKKELLIFTFTLTSCAGTACQFFVPKLQYFLSFFLSIFKHNNILVIINLLLLNNSDELSYTVRSLVMVRNQLPVQVVKLSHYPDK